MTNLFMAILMIPAAAYSLWLLFWGFRTGRMKIVHYWTLAGRRGDQPFAFWAFATVNLLLVVSYTWGGADFYLRA